MNQTPVRATRIAPAVQTPTIMDSPKTPLAKPKAPKLLMPYMKYTKRVWEDVKSKHPELKIWEISKIIGQMWRELDDSEKNRYNMEYEREKMQHEREKMEYEKAKQAYELEHGKVPDPADTPVRQTATTEDSSKTDSAAKLNPHKKSSKSIDPSTNPTTNSKFQDRLVLSQLQESNQQQHQSVVESRHEEIKEAHQRFGNNNKFMGTLFNQVQVEIRGSELEDRLKVYSTLSDRLDSFQKQLERDVEKIESSFTARKRDREEENDKFVEKANSIPLKIEKDEYQKMIDKALEDIKKQYDKFLPKVEPKKNEKKSDQKKDKEDSNSSTNSSKSNTVKQVDSKVHNPESIDLHDDDSASTEIDDEEMDSN